MPPGGTQFGDNRFAALAQSPQPKRKKAFQKLEEAFPDLPVKKSDDPKYIVIKSDDPTAPLSKISCFRVHNAILTVSKEINKISELRDGSLLLLVKNKQVAEKFIRTKFLFNIGAVSVSYHQHLNCNKGTIYAPFLNDVPESEIIEGLSSYEVSSVYKFTRKSEGETKHTGVILLSFECYTLPSKINIAWRMTTVRPYVPNPMRCKSCQKLGHTQKYCKSAPTCDTCNFPTPHENDCVRVMRANCSAEHRSSDISCPKYKQAKEILKIKTLEKCSMRDAFKKYKENISAPSFTASYAQVLQSPNEATSTKIPTINLTTKPKNAKTAADNDLPTTSKQNAGLSSANSSSINSSPSNNSSNAENKQQTIKKPSSLTSSHNNGSQSTKKISDNCTKDNSHLNSNLLRPATSSIISNSYNTSNSLNKYTDFNNITALTTMKSDEHNQDNSISKTHSTNGKQYTTNKKYTPQTKFDSE